MLNTAKAVKGYSLQSIDGAIGTVKEFYFDDQYWTIRYLVADTGGWLGGRQVLLSPYALGTMNKEEKHITVDLTKKQIEDSPSLDSEKPVSQQFETSYYGYHGYPPYWGGPHMWGAFPDIERDRTQWENALKAEKAWNPHLRSTREVSGYHIQAIDGELGHMDDFVIDDETWAIRYLIVATNNWWPGKKVLIAPPWIKNVSWGQSKVFINLSRESIKLSPEYTEESLVTRDYEEKLFHHYKRQAYWDKELVSSHNDR